MRGIAGGLGFAGSDAGGRGGVVVSTPIETYELNDAATGPARQRSRREAAGSSREAARRLAAMELDAAPAGNRGSGSSHSGVDHPKIPAAWAGRLRLIRELRTGRCLSARTLARACRASPSKAVTFVPWRKGRPVLPQIRKDHRIVGADNLGSHKHVAVEPDLAREVSAQRVGDFVVLGLMRHAMNSQGFVA
jgi:hypothetical protein